MPGLDSIFSSANFRTTVQKFCNQLGWKIADLNNDRAILRFNMNSGRTQTLYIIRYDQTLEFSVPSGAAFDNVDAIPHYLSTVLLKRSSDKKIGFWCIEEIGGKQVFSCMHNAEISLLNVEYFGKVVRALIGECDDFEGLLLKVLNQ